jgi:hypothetical protein
MPPRSDPFNIELIKLESVNLVSVHLAQIQLELLPCLGGQSPSHRILEHLVTEAANDTGYNHGCFLNLFDQITECYD